MANSEVTIHVRPLMGKTTILQVNKEITIATLFRTIMKESQASPSRAKLMLNKQLLENYGLGTKLQTIVHEQKEVSIYLVLKLGAYGYALGTLHRIYNSCLDKFVLSDNTDASNYDKFDTILSSIQQSMIQVENEVKLTRTQPIINEEDPISLEKLENPIVWFQNGKIFGMNIESVKEYVKRYSFEDENGQPAIRNPLTNEVIPFPWNKMLFRSAHD
jgi:hypothetical protein